MIRIEQVEFSAKKPYTWVGNCKYCGMEHSFYSSYSPPSCYTCFQPLPPWRKLLTDLNTRIEHHFIGTDLEGV